MHRHHMTIWLEEFSFDRSIPEYAINLILSKSQAKKKKKDIKTRGVQLFFLNNSAEKV